MATKLGKLRGDLERLQNTRRSIRLASGFGLLLNAVVGILVVAFLADWLLAMSVAQRGVLVLLTLGAFLWAFRRLTKPWLEQREELIELALMVERQQGIDSDLVSALQFESPEASQWGSSQLEAAVVTQVAQVSPQLNVFEGLSQDDFKRRMAIVGTVVVATLLTSVAAPDYVTAFLSRLMLSDRQYPTQTRIASVRVNDLKLLHFGELIDGKAEMSAPFGRSLEFEIAAYGERPTSGKGRVLIENLDQSIATEVDLVQTEELSSDIDPTLFIFKGELPRLMDSVTFLVELGDARSQKFRINAIPLPVVDVKINVTPPSYAGNPYDSGEQTGNSQRQLSVIEGSRIDISLTSLNKPVESAVLTIEKDEYRFTTRGSSAAERNLWTLNPEGTPLAAVTAPLRYSIQVTDDAGLQLDAPIHGTIRLTTDQTPRISAAVRTRKVIPTATPPVIWSASDDFGLSKVVAQVQIARLDGEFSEVELDVAPELKSGTRLKLLRAAYNLNLSDLQLEKGDEVRVTLVAYDFRGDQESQKSYSEPIVLQVTDRQGILSGLLETDEDSAKQIDAIIRRELGIGESK